MPWLLGGYMWLYLHRPFEYWTFLGRLQVERMYMIGVLVVWLVRPGKTWVMNRAHAAFAIYGTVLVACWLGSPFPSEEGYKIIENFAKVGVFYVLLLTTLKSEADLKRMILFYFVALALYQCHSLFEFANGRYEYRMGTVRMKGVDLTYGDPNTFAAQILHALPFLLPFWLTAKGSQSRYTISAYVLLSSLCVFLTGSRRAFIGLCFLVMVIVLRSRQRLMWLLLLLFLSPILFVSLRSDLQNRFLTIVDSSYGPSNAHTSGISRWLFFLDSLDLWEKYPITGVGPAAFGLALPHGMQPHNLYAQTIGELGTLGVLAVTFLVFALWRNAREIKRLYRDHPWWPKDFTFHMGHASWLAVVLLLVMGIGGHNLYRYNWLWFTAFQAVALECARRRAVYEYQCLPYLTPDYSTVGTIQPYPA